MRPEGLPGPDPDAGWAGGPGPFDPGLFGPGSVTWRVHADPAMALGGLRALMLQSLHPLATAGVAEHSQFRTDVWGRMFRTAEYVATVTYGTTGEARRAGARVRGVHRGLRGVEASGGQTYRVDDAGLLLWVHCAEIDSFLAAYQGCGGGLSQADADAYLAEQVRAAELVGIPPATVPATATALRAYFERMRPELRATPAAMEALRHVVVPPLPLPARPAWAVLTSLAFALLPRWARAAFGPLGMLTAHPGTDLAAAVAGRSLRSVAGLVPAAIRESPARRAALERMAAAEETEGGAGG